MLLRNESKVRHFIEIILVFDDNTTRELEIHEGELVHVTYRRNGCVKHGDGIIREIKPYIKKICCGIIESAIIVLDMSQDNLACVEKIELDDIIDITQFCCHCPDIDKNSPCNCGCDCSRPTTPPKDDCNCNKVQYSCVTGAALTNRGVVAHG